MLRPIRLLSAALLLVPILLTGCPPSTEQRGSGAEAASAEPQPERQRFFQLGDHHHEITTSSPEAQRYFDQGLILTFGFNHEEAIDSFQEAARLDPACVMCSWGVAYALGPNINAPMGPEAAQGALAAVAHAQALAGAASPKEQAYVAALATRYSADPEADRAALDAAYAAAMKELHANYPDDLDAATLYAEALMDLRPWQLYSVDGTPAPETPEIEAVLESVMERDPKHPGANHYYIHAVEASYTPERALPAAERLEHVAPEAGHLVHMPSHIFWRVGLYQRAEEINRRASAADEQYFSWCGRQGIYGAAYYPHNVHFLWAAASEQGDSELALMASRKLAAQIPDEMVETLPFTEQFRPIPVQTLARFGRWDAVLGEPAPPPAHRYSRGVWHYARGLAQLRKGDPDASAAELEALRAIAAGDDMAAQDLTGESAARSLGLAAHQLAGELAAERGDIDTAIAELNAGIAIQDSMVYTEPPRWHMSLRQTQGAILLESGRAAEAEAVYRTDLEHYPRTGWSLYGLAEALRAQGQTAEADLVQKGFEEAWANADVQLASSRF